MYQRKNHCLEFERLESRHLFAGGAELVEDIMLGVAGSHPTSLTRSGREVFFRANSDAGTGHLWKSDGSADGTVLVKDVSIVNGPEAQLTDVNGTLFFVGIDRSLWKSDGTNAGTRKVVLPHDASKPSFLTNVNGTLFLVAEHYPKESLFKTDGAEAGTVLLKEANDGSFQDAMVNLNGALFFTVRHGDYENNVAVTELWKTDGTAAGTELLKSFTTEYFGQAVGNLVAADSRLYFWSRGDELWSSDGTVQGTQMVKDIGPGTDPFPWNLTAVGDSAYFDGDDGVHGKELWKSDGTEAGTAMVKDIYPGNKGSTPLNITNVAGKLFFNALVLLSQFT